MATRTLQADRGAERSVETDPRARSREIFALLALTCLYLAVMSAHNYSIDGLLIYRQALAIAQNFSFHFAVPVYWGQPWSTSISGIGLALLYVPSIFLVTKLGLQAPVPTAVTGDWDLLYRDPVYAIGAAPIHILIAVATGYFVLRLVRALGFGWKTSLLALASYGIASPVMVYVRGDFPQPALGLWLMAGLLAAQHYRNSRRQSRLVLAGAALVMAVLTRQVEGSFLFPALVLMVLPDFRPARWTGAVYRDIAVLVASYAVAVALTLTINWARFGSFFQTGGYGFYWTTPPWIGIPGNLISPSRGIIWQFPLILLAPLGVRVLWSTRYRHAAIAVSALIAALFLNTATWATWWGGWSWGARLFVPAWPLVAILAAIGAMSLRQSIRVWVTAVLFAGGVIWALPGAVTDLLGGYAGVYDGTAHSFLLSSYPPLGAWQFVHHVRSSSLVDWSAIDILWFRIARHTGNASMLIPLLLAFGTAIFSWMSVNQGSSARTTTRPAPS